MGAPIRIRWNLVRQELPGFDSPNVDDRARAALSLLIPAGPDPSPAQIDPSTCPGCGVPCSSSCTPYCGEDCQERSRFVRQFRRALEESKIEDVQRQIGLGELLWLVLGGGRPRRLELAPPSAIRKALERTHGKCQGCGGIATTVDHIGSG